MRIWAAMWGALKTVILGTAISIVSIASGLTVEEKFTS